MARVGVIAGTSFLKVQVLEGAQVRTIETPWGECGLLEKGDLVYVPRHGVANKTPPHRINHRANLWALHELGVKHIVGANSVGSLKLAIPPKTIIIPDDYINLFSRVLTFYEEELRFVAPGISETVRGIIIATAARLGIPVVPKAIIIEAHGPRYETRAEIRMFQNFGDLVGMTSANEMTLARELDMEYATICCVDNYANGVSEVQVSMEEIEENKAEVIVLLRTLLFTVAEELMKL